MENSEEQGAPKAPEKRGNKWLNVLRATALAGVFLGGSAHQNQTSAHADENTVYNSGSATTQTLDREKLTHKLNVPGVAMDSEIQEAQKEKEVEIIMQGIESKLTDEEDVVITDKETLEKYWQLINNDPDRKMPTIEDGEVILLTARGQKNTLTATKIDRQEVDEDTLNIYVKDYLSEKEQNTSAFDMKKINTQGLRLNIIHDEPYEGEFFYNIASSAIGDKIGPQTLDITTESQ